MKKNTLAFTMLMLLFCSTAIAQSFYKAYGSPSTDEGGSTIVQSSDGNFFVGGYRADSALIMKIDPAGNIIWTRTFKPSPNYPNQVYGLAMTSDNYLIGTGNAVGGSPFNSRDGFYFKFDLNGNPQWVHRIVDNSRPVYLSRIIPASQNQYTLVGNICPSSNSWTDVFSARVDATTGTVTWQSPKIDYYGYIDDTYSATMSPSGETYSVHRYYIAGNANDKMRAAITKFSPSGNLSWSKYIIQNSVQSARIYGIDIIYNNDSLMVCYFGDKYGSSSNYSVGLARTDSSGNTVWSKDYNINGSTMELSQNVVSVPYGYVITGWQSTGVKDFFAIGVDLKGNVLWANSYGSAGSDESNRYYNYSNACAVGNDVYFTGESTLSGNTDIIVARLDQNGEIDCLSSTALNLTVTNNTTNTTVCPTNTTSDPLNFVSGPNTAITTGVPDNCTNLQSQNYSLGPDTNMCSVGSINLNFTIPGATSYLWSTGATQSSITITTPGTYWVTAYVNCCILTDTIEVQNSSNIVTSATGTATICSGQSTNLSATASGGNNVFTYLWQPGNLPGVSVTVSPTVTTTYTVTATDGLGCSSTSTVTVTVNPSAQVSITGNTQLCPGDTAFLSANGANSYTWGGAASGNSTSVIVVPGFGNTNVFLIGSNGNGCDDTTMVTIVLWDPPTVTVLGDDSICTGEITNLTCTGSGTFNWAPSSGLSSTTGQNVTASPTASTSYTVIVTDFNGCTDTTVFGLTVDACIGIDEFQSAVPNVRVTPNPAREEIQVSWDAEGINKLEILDITGKIVLSVNTGNQKTMALELKALNEGTYFVVLHGEGIMLRERIMRIK